MVGRTWASLQVFAGGAMGGDEIDVRPVAGEVALEDGDSLLAAGDLALDQFERGRASRTLGLRFLAAFPGRRGGGLRLTPT